MPQTAPAPAPAPDFFVLAVTTVHEGAAVDVSTARGPVLVLVHLDADGNAHVVRGSSFPASPAAEAWLAESTHELDAIEQRALQLAREERRSWLKHGETP